MSPQVSKVGFVTYQPPQKKLIPNDISLSSASRGDEESGVCYTNFLLPVVRPIYPTCELDGSHGKTLAARPFANNPRALVGLFRRQLFRFQEGKLLNEIGVRLTTAALCKIIRIRASLITLNDLA
jgi:hypothetical protein